MGLNPSTATDAERRRGVWLSVGAYVTWGAFPIYFKALHAPPLEVLADRVVWSALFLVGIASAQRRLPALLARARSPRVLLGSFLSATLLGVNWFVYIWAVAHDRVVDGSLGYFITPLVSVSLGVLLFREGLRPAQRLAIVTAALGVGWLTLQFGQLPRVGLALAFSFGSYAALRKRGVLDAFDGLLLEQVLMLPIAGGYLAWLAARGQNWFQLGSAQQAVLLVLTGPLSAVPLLMFAAGARKIPLSLVGVLQYISPTLQLLCGVLLWHEPFGRDKLAGYMLIWLALVIYTLEGAWIAKLRRREERAAQF
jgi:chloramphenicol-sensitive protein RarD